jgi:hypothetical protein
MDGAILTPRARENEKFYGRKVKCKDILSGHEKPPTDSGRLNEVPFSSLLLSLHCSFLFIVAFSSLFLSLHASQRSTFPAPLLANFSRSPLRVFAGFSRAFLPILNFSSGILNFSAGILSCTWR